MKTIGKLQINPDKVLREDELKELKGGNSWCGTCYVYEGWNEQPTFSGPACYESAWGADWVCNSMYFPLGFWCHCA